MRHISFSPTSKCILITGAATGVGAGYARQLAAEAVQQLILLDYSAVKLFILETELLSKYPKLSLASRVVSVRDAVALGKLILQYKPQVIIHTDGYRNNALMESNPCELVKQNIMGTCNLMQAAFEAGVEQVVLAFAENKFLPEDSLVSVCDRICEKIVLCKDISALKALPLEKLFQLVANEDDDLVKQELLTFPWRGRGTACGG